MLLLTALRAAWFDHGPCLRVLGFTWGDFVLRARKIAIHFLDGLEGPPHRVPDWKPLAA